MKSFLLYGPQDVRLAEKDMPECGATDVIIQPRYTGICGSDIHYFKDGYCGSFRPKYPFALGHEFSGIVYQVGTAVQSVSVGDAVAIDPSMPCGTCSFCREGHYNLCKNMRFFWFGKL